MLRSDDRRLFRTEAGRDGALPLIDDGTTHAFPPAAFGPFRVLHQVGAGSLGPVFRAHDPAEGRLVAVKAFRLDLPPERAAELAAHLEKLVSDQPRHPAIAAATAAGVEGSTAWLAQEYVPGDALDAVLRGSGPPAPAEALAMLKQIAEALDRAAGEGIHHGVLHPRDILVDQDGNARVIDIGVAQALERCHIRPPIRRPYSAPERSQGDWDGAADIYSLGAIAFELITGRRLAGPGRPAVSSPVLSHVAADEVAAALERALAVDPAERYPSAADLVDALAPPLRTVRTTAGSRRRGAPVSPPLLPLEPDESGHGPESRGQGPEARDQSANPAADRGSSAESESESAAAAPASASEPPRADAAVPSRVGAPVPESSQTEPAEPAGSAVPRFLGPPVDGAPEPDVHASDDLPLDSPGADAPSRFVALDDDEPAVAPAPEPLKALEQEEPSEVRTWHPLPSPTPPVERRPFLPILMALLVGIAAGFGWGYWTAWRSPGRQIALADAGQPAATTAAPGASAPDQAAGGSSGPVAIEEPEVVGERGLPPTTAAGAAGPSGQGSAQARQPAASSPGASSAPSTPPPTGSGARPTGSTVTTRPPATSTAPRQSAAARPAPAATGRLTIRSTPPGANVLVDGRLRGRTPLSLTDLPLRPVQVTVAYPGHAPDERRVVLSAAQPHVVIDAQLAQGTATVGSATPGPAAQGSAAAARTGSLVVESRPVGATVYLDDRQIGVTPLSMPGLEPGTYRIRLELSGFAPWVTAAQVRPGDRTRIAASLEPGGTPE